jgi:flagellar motility protein MotE (MotC chaperone)
VGNIGFDIFEFLGSTKLKQIQTLKELSGVTVEIDKIDMERKTVYDKRTYTNSRISEIEAVVANHPYDKEQIDKYSETIDLTALNNDLKGISDKINEWSRIDSGVKEFERNANYIIEENAQKKKKIVELEQQIAALNTQINGNMEKLAEVEKKIKGGKEWLDNNPKPDASIITEQIKGANEHNIHAGKIQDIASKHKELLSLKEKSSEFTVALEGFDVRKNKVLEGSKLPVKGLTFTDEEIYYNNLPFDESQIPKSKIIAIGAAISMALNPNLRVIVINDGSLLDKETLTTLMKIVSLKGYQLIVEMVSQDGGDLEIKFEEGV